MWHFSQKQSKVRILNLAIFILNIELEFFKHNKSALVLTYLTIYHIVTSKIICNCIETEGYNFSSNKFWQISRTNLSEKTTHRMKSPLSYQSPNLSSIKILIHIALRWIALCGKNIFKRNSFKYKFLFS